MEEKISWDSQIYILSKQKIAINIFIFFVVIPIAIFLLGNSNSTIFSIVLSGILMIIWPTILVSISDNEYNYLQVFLYKKTDANYFLSDEKFFIECLKFNRAIKYKNIISFSLTSPFNFGRQGEIAYAKSKKYNVIYMAVKKNFYTEILPIFTPPDKNNEIVSMLSEKIEQSEYLKTESKFLMNFGYVLITLLFLGALFLTIFSLKHLLF